MRHKQQETNNYTEFYYHFFKNILAVSLPLLVISAIVLSSLRISATGSSSGSTSSTDTLSFNISSSCTLSSVVDESHNAELINGTYVDSIGQTTITTLCNDGNGYSIYANGYSNNEEGNNKLVNTENSNFNIVSGTAQSGTTSNWAMSLNNLADDPSLTPPTIENAYNNTYGIVPTEWTKVVSLPARATDMIKGSSFTTTYAVYTSSSQYAGTYNGQVKYVLTHPNSNAQHFFMQNVAEWKEQMLPHEGDSIQVIDQRDGKKYWVTRLADGNVWMTQNLDLDLDPAKPLTSNDTDLIDHSLTGAYTDGYNHDPNTGITTWTPERKTIDFQNTTVTGWTNDNNNPYSANKTDSTETGHASLGNWYNWTVAIASNNSSSLTQDALDNILNNPKNSICPKGWRLPAISNQSGAVASSTNEFARLNYLYNNDSKDRATWLTAPLYFAFSGYVASGALDNLATEGLWRTSTTRSDKSSYSLDLSPSNGVLSAYESPRVSGYSVRCVAR